MAEDARISTAFPGHPKTVKVKRRIGIVGCWHLMCLFLWTANNRWDGNLSGLSDEDIEIACGWEGELGSFISVLCDVGYLDGEPNQRVIHDWAEHNPYAANRGKRLERSRKALDKKYGKDTKTENKDTTSILEVDNKDTPHHTTPHPPATPKKQVPEWIPNEQWNGFLQMRSRIKSTLTGRAIQLAIDKLSKLRDEGHDPGAVLDQSTMRGWKGLFALSEDYHNGTNQPVNRSRARQETQRDELLRAEEMDSQGAFDTGDHDERNGHSGGLKRLCESVGGPAASQVAKGIPGSRSNPQILPKTSRTN